MITITPLERGYVVEVGCSSFAFETKKRLIEYFEQYINDPQTTETKWFAGTLFED